jgi:hypothetical protein
MPQQSISARARAKVEALGRGGTGHGLGDREVGALRGWR